jgi:hypothetical protein
MAGELHDYTNNKDRTSQLEREWGEVGGEFSLRLAGKNRLLLGLKGRNVDFDDSASGARDNDDVLMSVGYFWSLSRKTTVEAKIGYRRKDFEGSEFSDYNNFDWQFNMRWVPTSRMVLTVGTQSEVIESYLTDTSFIDQNVFRAGWEQDWNYRLKSEVKLSWADSDFEDNPDGRRENVFAVSAGAEYLLSRTFSILGGVSFRDRDGERGSGGDLDYNRSVVKVAIKASL